MHYWSRYGLVGIGVDFLEEMQEVGVQILKPQTSVSLFLLLADPDAEVQLPLYHVFLCAPMPPAMMIKDCISECKQTPITCFPL